MKLELQARNNSVTPNIDKEKSRNYLADKEATNNS